MGEEGFLSQLLRNPIFLSAVFSWMMAQILKVLINLFRRELRESNGVFLAFLWKTGGMPSSHSSAVTALTTAVGFVEGVNSSIFIVTLIMSVVVIRDALGVRRSAGNQARVINKIVHNLKQNVDTTLKTVKEINGHTFPEVAVGITLGFFMAVAFCNL